MKNKTIFFSRPLVIFIAFFTLTSQAQISWKVVETLSKSPGNQYGEAVAVSRNGNIAAVTQALEPCTDGKLRCGAVYIYAQDQGHWSQQAKLFASDAVQNTLLGGFDFFDRTITLNDDGTVMAVATNPNGLGKGAVYVFVNNGSNWVEQQKITLPIALLPTPQICGNDTFGRSLALSGDGNTLIVGTGNECLALNTGSAFLFTKTADQWIAQTRLVGSRVEPSGDGNIRFSVFGSSVDISGDGSTLLVGSPGFPSDLKQAYIYNKNVDGGWFENAILAPSDKSEEVNFGFSVALDRSGNTALVGNLGGFDKGTAYVFSKNGNQKDKWEQEAKLGANITQLSGNFGFSLDLDDSGTQAIIGDWGTSTAFLFSRVKKYAWSPQLIDSLGGGNGSSVTISGDTTVILDSGPGRFTILKK
jgi:FG-GAP repeat